MCSLHQSTFFSQQTAVKMRTYTGKATCILRKRERESAWTCDIDNERDRTQHDATRHAAHRLTILKRILIFGSFEKTIDKDAPLLGNGEGNPDSSC